MHYRTPKLHSIKTVIKKGALILFACILSLAGCTTTTTGIWEKPTYTDKINRFLITVDGEKIIFLGDKYHYVFLNSRLLSKVLLWKGRGILEAQLNDSFVVDKSSNITGDFRVICKCDSATNEQVNELMSFGFKKETVTNHNVEKAKYIYALTFNISGSRYVNSNLDFSHYSKLNKSYEVTVRESYTAFGVVGRILLTPIAVAEDGVATIGLIPLMAIALPFYVIDKQQDK